MIILKTLKWSNCFSYGPDNVIELNKDTLTQILGKNGYGKSSIPLIIEEVLFNKNSKGIKKADIANREIPGGTYWINLTWEKDSVEYVVDVKRQSNSTKVKLFKNGEDISSHTATGTFNTIKEILGMDFKFFPQIIYQGDTSSLEFLTATDTARKKFLVELMHLDNYIKLHEQFKEVAKNTSLKLERVRGVVDTINKWLEENSKQPLKLLDLQEVPTVTVGEKIPELKRAISEINQSNTKITRNNRVKEELSKINIAEAQAKVSEGKPENTVITKTQRMIGGLTSELKRLQAVIKKIKEIGDTCPTCSQPVHTKYMLEEHVEEFHDKNEALKKAQQEVKELEASLSEYERAEQLVSKWQTLYNQYDSKMPSQLQDYAKLNSELADLETKLKEEEKRVKDIIRSNDKASAHNARVKFLQEEISKRSDELKEAKKVLRSEESAYSNLEILKKAFSTNGLLAYKIENMVKELEDMSNEYLAELSSGRFGLAFEVVRDKLNVVISDNGKEVDIRALSSGERARVNISTLLAIRKMMSSISRSKVNVLFLDEVINALDMSGRERLVEVLMKEEALNTFIVSHGWDHPLVSKINVVQTNKISRLEEA